MQRTDYGEMNCSIARAVAVLCEPWTPLVLRDILLGIGLFEDIRTDLGISTNVLADRLHTLVDHGVVERRAYGRHPGRFEYRLTDKGRDAVSVLLELLAWGDRWEDGGEGAPTEMVHRSCGQVTATVAHCAVCGERLELRDLEFRNGPASHAGPGTQLLREHLAR
jgi:DNA-binding HxlR family transcriptional regulator